jgi:signal transduction histidine kinase
MSLRRTTILAVLLTIVGLVFLLLVNLRLILSSYFDDEERRAVQSAVQRARTALGSELTSLNQEGREWAQRADIFQIIASQDLTKIDTGLKTDELVGQQINFIAWTDSAGKLLYARFLDLSRGQVLPLPQELGAHLKAGDPLLQFSSDAATHSGIFKLESDPLLIVSYPLGNGGTSGASPGTVLVGRLMDALALDRLARLTQMTLSLGDLQDPALSQDFVDARANLTSPQDIFIEALDEASIAGYALLTDVYGQPAYLMQVIQPRTIHKGGEVVTSYLIIFQVGSAIIFTFIILVIVEWAVLSRLTRLSAEVNRIGQSHDLTQRVTISRNDELSRLSRNINQTLAELEQAQRQRQESEALFRTLYETSQVLLGEIEPDATLKNICRQAVERFGLDLAWISLLSPDRSQSHPAVGYGRNLGELASADILKAASWPANDRLLRQEVMASGQVKVVELSNAPGSNHLPGGTYQCEAIFPLASGETARATLNLYSFEKDFFTAERQTQIQAFVNLGGMALQSAMLYEQVRSARRRLEALSHRLVEVQEEERRRLAQELHDEIGQVLTGLKLMLDSSVSLASPQLVERLSRAQYEVNELIGQVRQISLDLRPAMLDDLGLLPTLLWFFDRYKLQTEVEVEFSHTGMEGRRLPPAVETAAYRVVQEALTNVARHAAVKRVSVHLMVVEERLVIQIEDRGAGFDPEAVMQGGDSRGLVGMRERVGSLDGELVVESSPGSGTSLIVELPITSGMGRE